ncbi:GNAT family N-acetyltransferase [Patulibacter sp.]|uniref:GNAT family N-acetyltransferase n=1 Tax=Patulibacter sp. TaxID=1912859 RepID=UPI00271B176A|nr:GNAT family N-acetyltransferase [Patulibacter sp.]MDO9410389.1 GNAT family N-acetyltransferase [Patulibacter sp.]
MFVPLHDGSEVLIRAIGPQDAALLRRAHQLLSPETVRDRFLGAKPRLSSTDVRYLTDVDQHAHVALVAVDRTRPERILGVARWVRDPARPSTAEAAFVVTDDYQGTGIGSALAIGLADRAVEEGVASLSGSMLAGNRASEALFRRMGGELTVRRDGITNEVTTTLPAESGRLERLAASRRMRPGRRRVAPVVGGHRPQLVA